MKDIYLKFTPKQNSKKIPGESLDDKHKDGLWMEIEAWEHVLRQPKSATSSTAGGHTAERCEHGEMLFTKDIDTSSPYIWEACSAGYAYDVEIQFFRAQGSTRTQYLTIKLYNAVVSSVNPTVKSEGLPTETMGIKYAKVVWTYSGSKTDGSANVGQHIGGWDLALNKVAA
ncbi:MAG TPA: type VI secretion system tube protein Hcp [Aquabacterium sp.]|uniref:Hcp family type VI secretion system effector n=1 Tax=Aquabacterium sp. TaxID=1872578 RepID=UPI002E3710E6|nr:type VI secretion system tube protein Hcp [Aquabacterium sp.]HEX5356852.1 type VI secretion system tube protein Hcp [Aquabacterium sp.]